jgi:hypothetical protein
MRALTMAAEVLAMRPVVFTQRDAAPSRVVYIVNDVRVQACLRRMHFPAVRCNNERRDLQHVSVWPSSFQLVEPDFNPKVAGSIPARPTS